jgi:hypothetical protein
VTWTLDVKEDVEGQLGGRVPRCVLINDFVANGMGLQARCQLGRNDCGTTVEWPHRPRPNIHRVGPESALLAQQSD